MDNIPHQKAIPTQNQKKHTFVQIESLSESSVSSMDDNEVNWVGNHISY